MKQSKEELISTVKNYTGFLKQYLTDLKIKEDYFDLHEDVDKLHISNFKKAHDWLVKVFGDELSKYQMAIKLLTPDQWRRYELWGDDFQEHREVLIKKEAQVNLRKVLVSLNRPDLFKKGYVDGQLKQIQQRSEESSNNSNRRNTRHKKTNDNDERILR